MNSALTRITTPPSIAIADEVRRMVARGKIVAKLQTGEPSFETPEYISHAVLEGIEKGLTHYCSSTGLPLLKEALVSWYYRRFNIDLNPDSFFIDVGAVSALNTCCKSLLNYGDMAAIVEPGWNQYKNIIELCGAKAQVINAGSSDFRLRPASLAELDLSKLKLLIINNPTNPTGVVYDEQTIRELLTLAKENDFIILFDEVYNGIIFEKPSFSSVLQLIDLNNFSENVIYINSFSKYFSMTGWRIGYAYVPETMILTVKKVVQNSITAANTFCQFAAAKALNLYEHHQDVYDKRESIYKERRNELMRLMDANGLSYIRPGGAFYFFINCRGDSEEFADRLLKEHKIAVVPGTAYGNYRDYFRVSFATDSESFHVFCKWLKQMKNGF